MGKKGREVSSSSCTHEALHNYLEDVLSSVEAGQERAGLVCYYIVEEEEEQKTASLILHIDNKRKFLCCVCRVCCVLLFIALGLNSSEISSLSPLPVDICRGVKKGGAFAKGSQPEIGTKWNGKNPPSRSKQEEEEGRELRNGFSFGSFAVTGNGSLRANVCSGSPQATSARDKSPPPGEP